jgi:hypothetical protein
MLSLRRKVEGEGNHAQDHTVSTGGEITGLRDAPQVSTSHGQETDQSWIKRQQFAGFIAGPTLAMQPQPFVDEK